MEDRSNNMIPIALKSFMKISDIKQIDIANITGLSSSYISMILNGSRTPEIGKLKQICSSMGVDLATFFLKVSELEQGLDNKKVDFSKAFEIVSKLYEQIGSNDSGDGGVEEEEPIGMLEEA